MGYLNCPNCAQRLRVPDTQEPMRLKCPACKAAFRSDGLAISDEGPEGPSAEDPSEVGEDTSFLSSDLTTGRILSQADEAMLRDYGSGSGLLELTRDAYEVSASQPAPAGMTEAPPPALASAEAPPAAPPSPQSREELDRQFQIIGTALALANKLVQAHKAELARTRGQSALGWALLAAMTIGAGVLGWLAVRQSGLTDLERNNVVNLTKGLGDAAAQLAEHKTQAARLAEELSTLRAEQKTTQAEQRTTLAELSTAKESLAEKKGAMEAQAAELKAADARNATQAGEVQRLQGDLAAARQALSEAKTPTTGPTTSPSPTTGPG